MRSFAPSRVEGSLLHLALWLPIVSDAASRRLALAMGPATPERTAQVPPPSIAPIGEKEDPAVPASGQALSQPGFNPQHRAQHHVVRQHQRRDHLIAIPLRVESKTPCDLSCKKPRLSL